MSIGNWLESVKSFHMSKQTNNFQVVTTVVHCQPG